MLYISDNAHFMARHGAKFRGVTSIDPKVIGANTLHFKPILTTDLPKIAGKPHPLWSMG